MFSGIVETTGTITRIDRTDAGARLTLSTNIPVAEVSLGESICINGTCLTVVTIGEAELSFDVSAESLRRTNLGDLQPGDQINLERSLRVNDRLSGHLVFGHVDGVGRVKAIQPDGDSFLYTFEIPPDLSRYLVEKGSVAVDGISLTVFHCQPTEFTCAIIPHTYQVTTLHARSPGDRVNIECDMQGKYIEKFVQEAVAGFLSGPLQALREQIAALRQQMSK
ncbi:MAG TPA: riboflavin synthase [Candidatus Binatia bacterium]|jgi:riboflavin synthase|nr:riboflavin synthase [Candidatus Binatia bacterium]